MGSISSNTLVFSAHRSPLPHLAENVQADVSLLIHVGVVELCVAVDLGGLVGVQGGYGEGELVRAAGPVAGVGRHGDEEGGEAVGGGKVHVRDGTAIQLGYVLLDADLPRCALRPSERAREREAYMTLETVAEEAFMTLETIAESAAATTRTKVRVRES